MEKVFVKARPSRPLPPLLTSSDDARLQTFRSPHDCGCDDDEDIQKFRKSCAKEIQHVRDMVKLGEQVTGEGLVRHRFVTGEYQPGSIVLHGAPSDRRQPPVTQPPVTPGMRFQGLHYCVSDLCVCLRRRLA
jgi:hypothetical protein